MQMSNLNRALRWAELGVAVFPCHEKDSFEGTVPKRRKAPRTTHGFKDATTEISVITSWWTENPDHLVGLVAGDKLVILDIDMDAEKGKDGWSSIFDQNLDIPDTFHTTTPSKGSHYFFRHPDGVLLSPLQDVSLPSGIKLDAVDRRSGGSYVIAWSEEIPKSIEDLAPCPEWLRGGPGTRAVAAYSGSTEDWISALPAGMSDVVAKFIETRIPRSDFNHATMISRQASLVSLGARRYAGVTKAIDELRAEWLRPPYDTDECRRAWDSALAGAVAKFGGQQTATMPELPDEPDPHKVQQLFKDELAKREATRLIADRYFVGSEEMSWSTLRELDVNYIVDGLLPSKSVVFLVARRNLGKTFTYIDMICCVALGWPWLNKATRPTKTTVVLGEGQAGFYERILAWCSFHSVDVASLERYLSFIDGANLNSDTSLSRIRKVTERHGSELVIFDTWATTAGVLSEDDAALTSETLIRAQRVAPNGTILFTHHPRKSSDRADSPVMRGSSTLDGRADVVITMFPDKKFRAVTGKQQDWIALSTESEHGGKNRTARTETIRGIYIHGHKDSAVLRHHESETISAEALVVKEFLIREMTLHEFAEASGRKTSTARRYLDKAIKEGFALVRKGSGNIGNLYSPAPPNSEIDFLRLMGESLN